MASPATASIVPASLIQSRHRHVSLRRGTILFESGDPASTFFVVESGLVKVSRTVDGAGEFLHVVSGGGTVGERAVLTQGPRQTTAEALSNCVLWEIRIIDFVRCAEEAPELWAWIARQLGQRLSELERRINRVVNQKVETRILLTLADLAESQGGPAAMRIPLTQHDIAMLIGATRETTSTTLNNLERRGLVKLGRGFIEVGQAETLRAVL